MGILISRSSGSAESLLYWGKGVWGRGERDWVNGGKEGEAVAGLGGGHGRVGSVTREMV